MFSIIVYLVLQWDLWYAFYLWDVGMHFDNPFYPKNSDHDDYLELIQMEFRVAFEEVHKKVHSNIHFETWLRFSRTFSPVIYIVPSHSEYYWVQLYVLLHLLVVYSWIYAFLNRQPLGDLPLFHHDTEYLIQSTSWYRVPDTSTSWRSHASDMPISDTRFVCRKDPFQWKSKIMGRIVLIVEHLHYINPVEELILKNVTPPPLYKNKLLHFSRWFDSHVSNNLCTCKKRYQNISRGYWALLVTYAPCCYLVTKIEHALENFVTYLTLSHGFENHVTWSQWFHRIRNISHDPNHDKWSRENMSHDQNHVTWSKPCHMIKNHVTWSKPCHMIKTMSHNQYHVTWSIPCHMIHTISHDQYHVTWPRKPCHMTLTLFLVW